MGLRSLQSTTTQFRRRKTEKRKEKSREAARHRRSQESNILTDMANLLPLPISVSSLLDKTSILRLTLAFLKTQSLLDSSEFLCASVSCIHELFSMLYEDKCSMADSCWLKALGGLLLALSSEGDIIYLTENVIEQLGIQQLDLIGRSVFDYCHPCDHSELREILSLRCDGELGRSCFLRFKSTLTTKGRINNNRKTDNYKVMNCSGRIVMATTSNARLNCSLEDYFNEEHELGSDSKGAKVVKSSTSHFLVLVCDPIPHPFKVEFALDSQTFLTNHTLDMKFTYVDEMMCQFFGYTMEDLKDRSAYQFHHAQDNESILKSYKTMITKGQIQTPPYRFLAKQGGYAWVQTQATVVSVSNRNIRSQTVVCIHTRLSNIEEGDQILFVGQAQSSADGPAETQYDASFEPVCS